MEILFELFSKFNPLTLALIGGIFLALLNVVGATTIFFVKELSARLINAGLGLAAGIMMAASFTSLILPGVEIGGVFPVLIGIGIGAIFILIGDRLIGKFGIHSYSPTHKISSRRFRGVLMFTFAVTLHNLPEGLAVGVGFGAQDISNAITLMLAIGVQNIPEGLAVGFSLISTERFSRIKSYFISFLSGAVEIPLAILGAIWVTIFVPLLPYAMGFAAGAMIFVIAHEIIPETQREKTDSLPTLLLILGLVVMLLLDLSL